MTEPTNYYVREPSVLVLHEKHGDDYWRVNDDAELNRAALEILRRRDAEGYWYLEPKREWYVDVKDDDTITRFEAIPPETLAMLPAPTRAEMRAAYDEAKEHLRRAEPQLRRDQAWWRLMKGLLAQPAEVSLARTNQAGRPLAWLVLQERGDGEYEGVSVEKLRIAEG